MRGLSGSKISDLFLLVQVQSLLFSLSLFVWVANSLVVDFVASSILCVDFVSLFVVASLWFWGVLRIVLCLFPACEISSVLSFFARKKKIYCRNLNYHYSDRCSNP